MSKNKPPQASKKTDIAIIRSSAAEYLTFVAASGHGGVEAVYADENVWITQKMMGLLYDVETHTINYHLKKVFSDSELVEESVIRNFRITAADGKGYNTLHYNLSAIGAVTTAGVGLSGCGRGYGVAQDAHDHAGLGSAPEPLHRSHRPGRFAGRRKGDGRNCQGAC